MAEYEGEDHAIHANLIRLGATEEEAEDLIDILEEEGWAADESAPLKEEELRERLERYRRQRAQEELD